MPVSERVYKTPVVFDQRSQHILADLKAFWAGPAMPALSNSILVRYALDLAEREMIRAKALSAQERQRPRRLLTEACKSRER